MVQVMKKVVIPFAGFYCTEYDEALNYQLEQDSEHTELTPDELDERVNWKATHQKVAESYATQWLSDMEWEGARFHGLWSPREYNFESDEIIVEVPVHYLKKLEKFVETEEFQKWLIDTYTSRDGFMSFVSTNVDLWPEDYTQKEYSVILQYVEAELPHELPCQEQILDTLRGNGHFELVYE